MAYNIQAYSSFTYACIAIASQKKKTQLQTTIIRLSCLSILFKYCVSCEWVCGVFASHSFN